MDLQLTIIIAFFALCIGSFLNVVIYRLPRELSVSKPRRSFCPNCKKEISWYENIPVLSWLVQGGKCRGCKCKISGQYPLVEILSAFAAIASYQKFGFNVSALIIYFLTISLIAITFIDLEFKIIPNLISFPGMTFGLCMGIYAEFFPNTFISPPLTTGALDSLIGFLVGGGFFYLVGLSYYIFTKRIGLGGGDIKLMAMTGAMLGWESVAPTIFVGSLAGSVVGVLAILFSGGGRHTEIPFGPWLALGSVLYIFADLPFFKF